MRSRKVYLLYQLLTPKEQFAFMDFVLSPYINKQKSLTTLFYWIHKMSVSPIIMSPEEIWNQIFPAKPFKDNHFRALLQKGVKLLEQFLIWENQKEEEDHQQLVLVSSLRKRNNSFLFNSASKKLRKRLNNHIYQHIDQLQCEMHLAQEEYDFQIQHTRNVAPYLNELGALMNKTIIAQRLKFACLNLAYNTIYVEKETDVFLRICMEMIEKEPSLTEHPYIAFYYYYYQAMNSPKEEKWFEQLIQTFEKNIPHLPAKEIQDGLFLIINYYIGQIRINPEAIQMYYEKGMALYQMGLENEILFTNGELNHQTYANIVRVGLFLKRYNWTQDFIEQYQSFLPKKYQENYYNFNLGLLFYRTKDYEKAMLYLSKFDDRNDFINQCRANIIRLKIYFELDQDRLLFSTIESFRMYLHRKQTINKERKETYFKFIFFIKKVHQALYKKKEVKVLLEQKIIHHPQLIERKWLLKQLEK